MADYKTRINEETGITFVEVRGDIVLEEHLPYMKSKTFSNRTLRLVADARKASLAGMPRGTIAKMVRTVKPLEKSNMRAAYVFNKGDDFAKGKLLLAQIEVLGYEGSFRIFTDIEKAIVWVKE